MCLVGEGQADGRSGDAEETEVLLSERWRFRLRVRGPQPPGVVVDVECLIRTLSGLDAARLCVYLRASSDPVCRGDVALFIHEAPCQPEST